MEIKVQEINFLQGMNNFMFFMICYAVFKFSINTQILLRRLCLTEIPFPKCVYIKSYCAVFILAVL